MTEPDFYQVMWYLRPDYRGGYFSTGSYFKTLEEAIEFLREDCKKDREKKRVHLGEVHGRWFGTDKRDRVVYARQIFMGPAWKNRTWVEVLQVDLQLG